MPTPARLRRRRLLLRIENTVANIAGGDLQLHQAVTMTDVSSHHNLLLCNNLLSLAADELPSSFNMLLLHKCAPQCKSKHQLAINLCVNQESFAAGVDGF